MNRVESLIYNARELAGKNWLKAVNILHMGLEEFPKEPQLYVLMGDIYLQRNAPARSIDYYKKAIQLGNPGDDLLTKIADTYLSIDDFTSSLKYYDMLKDVPPQTIHKKVYVLHRLNKFNAALHLLEEIIWESPYPETIIQYAEIQAQLGKNKKALEYIEIGRTRFGDDHRFLALAGMIHYLSGHYMLACRFFHLVDHADENTWRSRYLFMYAKSSLFIGFIDKGISLLEEFLLRMNQDIDVFRFYLIEMFKAGRISSAEQFLSTLEESGKVKGITLTSMKLSLNYYLELGKPPR